MLYNVLLFGPECVGGHVLWEGQAGELGMDTVMPAATASICVPSPYGPALCGLVVFGGAGPLVFSIFCQGGRKNDLPYEGLVSNTWPQWWMWSAVDVGIPAVNQLQGFEVPGKKKPSTLGGRPLCPQDWEGLRKDGGVTVL